MKVLHIINSLDKGGAERLLVNFLPELNKQVSGVSLLLLNKNKSEESYLKILAQNDISVVGLSSGSIYNPLNVIKLFRFIRNNKFDIIHVHLFPSLYWVSFAMKMLSGKNRAKLIFTEHSTQNNRFKKKIFKPIDRFVYNSYNRIIAISPNIESILNTWTGRPEKNIVIRNGLDINLFMNAIPYSKQDLSSSLDLPTNAFTILMSARFLYPKKQSFLIEVLHKLPPIYHLLFAGIGDGMAQCKELALNFGLENRVHFLGFRNDIPQLMKSVDLNILATEYEGMSGVTLEALASGRPFLGSDVPGVNDIVPDSSFLFSHDIDDTVDKIVAIADSEEIQNKMSEQGIRYGLQFDMLNMVKRHYELYSQLIS